HVYRRPAVVFSLLALVVGALVFVFFLPAAAKTYRWIHFPGFSFQPSELAKLSLVFFLAYFLEKRKGKINEITFTLVPVGIIVGLLAGLIVIEPDLGTAMTLIIVCGILLFVAGLDLRWIAGSVALSMPLLYMLVFRVKYRRDRILAFLN